MGILGVLVIAFLLVNFVVQIYKKPSEVLGMFASHFHKSPHETWQNYRDDFEAKATSILTPDFLAALAQSESNGNPIVSTYWKWRWTSDWQKAFAPASSAVGLFQITEPTFQEARHFCVREGRVYRDDSDGEHCLGTAMYSRLVPAHAIEMTAARLHYYTARILGKVRAHVKDRDRQALAAIIHLCGIGKGERFARGGFQAAKIGRCGDHDPAAYLKRVRGLQQEFRQLAAYGH